MDALGTAASLPPRPERQEDAVVLRQVRLQGLLKFEAERNFMRSRVVLGGTVPDVPAHANSDAQVALERDILRTIDLQVTVWFERLAR